MEKENIINRAKYFEIIEPFMGDSLIKIFTGQRRVGKSYLLYQVMEKIRKVHTDKNFVNTIFFDGITANCKFSIR